MKAKLLKFVSGLGLVAVTGGSAFAVDGPADGVVTSVTAITTTATTAYVAAAGLGVAVLVVGTVVYLSKRGWKLR